LASLATTYSPVP